MIFYEKIYQKFYCKLCFCDGSCQQQALYSFLGILFSHIQSHSSCVKACFPQFNHYMPQFGSAEHGWLQRGQLSVHWYLNKFSFQKLDLSCCYPNLSSDKYSRDYCFFFISQYKWKILYARTQISVIISNVWAYYIHWTGMTTFRLYFMQDMNFLCCISNILHLTSFCSEVIYADGRAILNFRVAMFLISLPTKSLRGLNNDLWCI